MKRKRIAKFYGIYLVLCKFRKNSFKSVLITDYNSLFRSFCRGHLNKSRKAFIGSKAYKFVFYVAQTVCIKFACTNRFFPHIAVRVCNRDTVFKRKNIARGHGGDFSGAVTYKCFRRGKNFFCCFCKGKLMKKLKLKRNFFGGNFRGFSFCRKFCRIKAKNSGSSFVNFFGFFGICAYFLAHSGMGTAVSGENKSYFFQNKNLRCAQRRIIQILIYHKILLFQAETL